MDLCYRARLPTSHSEDRIVGAGHQVRSLKLNDASGCKGIVLQLPIVDG